MPPQLLRRDGEGPDPYDVDRCPDQSDEERLSYRSLHLRKIRCTGQSREGHGERGTNGKAEKAPGAGASPFPLSPLLSSSVSNRLVLSCEKDIFSPVLTTTKPVLYICNTQSAEEIKEIEKGIAAHAENSGTRGLTYGTQVNIQHVQSGLYVSLSSARAKQDGALKLKLAPDNLHSGFTVLPGYKSSSLGDVVQYGHGLTFRNDVLKNYIHVAQHSRHDESEPEKWYEKPLQAAPQSQKPPGPWWDRDGHSDHHHPYVESVLECNGLNKPSVAIARRPLTNS